MVLDPRDNPGSAADRSARGDILRRTPVYRNVVRRPTRSAARTGGPPRPPPDRTDVFVAFNSGAAAEGRPYRPKTDPLESGDKSLFPTPTVMRTVPVIY